MLVSVCGAYADVSVYVEIRTRHGTCDPVRPWLGTCPTRLHVGGQLETISRRGWLWAPLCIMLTM